MSSTNESESRLDQVFLATGFPANHPLMLDWANIKFALKRARQNTTDQPVDLTHLTHRNAFAEFEKWVSTYEENYPDRSDFALTMREREMWLFGYNHAESHRVEKLATKSIEG